MSKKLKILLVLFIAFFIVATFLVLKIFPSLQYYGFFNRHPVLRIFATILIIIVSWVRRWLFLLILFLWAIIIGYLFLKNLQKKKLLLISGEKRETMETFFEYWKKGWKVWLMMVCVSFSYLLLFLPVALVTGLLKYGTGVYYFIATIVGLTFAPPLTYFIFKLFYGEQ